MATIERKLNPWTAPNFAVEQIGPRPRQEGFTANQLRIPVAELPTSTLDEMAADWLAGLYRKAGKQSPWKNMG